MYLLNWITNVLSHGGQRNNQNQIETMYLSCWDASKTTIRIKQKVSVFGDIFLKSLYWNQEQSIIKVHLPENWGLCFQPEVWVSKPLKVALSGGWGGAGGATVWRWASPFQERFKPLWFFSLLKSNASIFFGRLWTSLVTFSQTFLARRVSTSQIFFFFFQTHFLKYLGHLWRLFLKPGIPLHRFRSG